ncbi:hypothetical protein QBC39DRAFT_340421 [Podospora conica]|nr:hypothetical protein QBC39DRAFT_340421 [Schizothecium conicum]
MGDINSEADDGILQTLASNGTMDYSEWPRLLPNIVARIEKIAHTEFPIPNFPAPRPPQPPRAPSPRFLAPLPSSDPIDGPESSDTAAEPNENDKENAIPSSSPLGSRSANASSSSTLQAAPSSPPVPSSTPQTSQQLPSLPSQPPQQEQVPEPGPLPGTLPTQVAGLLNEVTSTLSLNFPTYPPHTVQRLAELVLKPRQQHRSVVSYLHALDRVVHVTSGANNYPLPPAVPDQAALSQLVNGGGSSAGPSGALSINTDAARVGSDEALGGALLTPIPWLTGRANGGSAVRATAGSSDDGHDDAENTSPLGPGLGPGLPQQPPQPQQQRQTPSSSLLSAQATGPSEGSSGNNPKIRTESTETIEGPNGMGSIETVSISVNGIHSTGAGLVQRGVTQGEILRQEQRAGIVPLNQFTREVQQQLRAAAAEEDAPMGGDDDPTADAQHEDDDEEVPHARGPAEIGAADMGPQPATRSVVVVSADGVVTMRGVDVEGAVGRRQDERADATVPESPKREAAEELAGGASPKRMKDEEAPKLDAEGDVVIGEAGPGAEAAQEVPVAKDEDKEMTGNEAGTNASASASANDAEI